MQRPVLIGSAALAVTALLVTAAITPAEACIECRGNFQVSNMA